MPELKTYRLDTSGWRALDNAAPIVVPPANEPPTAVTGLLSIPSSTSVQLSWNPATDPEGGAVRYVVRQGTTLLTATPILSASYTVTGLTPATSYSFTVAAVDSAGAQGPAGSITTSTTAPSGFPDATNTGYRNAPGYPGSLTPYTGGAFTSGATYEFMDIGQCKVGDETTTLDDVTFIGCRFKVTDPGAANVRLYSSKATFQYCSFEPDIPAPPVSYAQSYQYALIADGGYGTHVGELLVEYCDFWGFHDAIPLAGESGDPARIIRHNWFHDSAATGGTAHVDFIGNLSPNGALKNVTIQHNTMVGDANSSILGFQYGPYADFMIIENLLGGGGYTVEVAANGSAPTGITFTDNTFTTGWQPVFGPLYPSTFWTGGGNTWRRNRWHVPAGAPWGKPANDGKYWMPVSMDASENGWNDDPFVSDTDYTG